MEKDKRYLNLQGKRSYLSNTKFKYKVLYIAHTGEQLSERFFIATTSKTVETMSNLQNIFKVKVLVNISTCLQDAFVQLQFWFYFVIWLYQDYHVYCDFRFCKFVIAWPVFDVQRCLEKHFGSFSPVCRICQTLCFGDCAL